MCGLPYAKPHMWNPDRSGVTERLHCSLRCSRMYRIAYVSDHTLRLEHAIKRANDELDNNPTKAKAIELRLRIRSLKRGLKATT